MDTTGCKHGDLELHMNGRAGPRLGPDSRHELHLGVDPALGLSGETLHAPHNGLLFRLIPGTAKQDLVLGLGGVAGYRDLDDHLRGKQLVGKVGNDLEVDADTGVPVLFLYCGNDSEREIDVVRDTVPHQLELAVGRDERDGPVGIELSETNTAMKGAVINLDGWFPVGSRLLPIDNELVVQSELALWHTRQLCVHLDLYGDFVPEDRSCAAQKQIHTFQYY